MKTSLYPIKWLILLLTLMQSVDSVAAESQIITAGERLSLRQLVAAVLQANPRLAIAQASWQVALASIEQQSAFDDPQFKYSFAPLTVASQAPNGQDLDFGQRFEISQKLPFPGKLHLRGQAAEYQAQSKQQDINTLQLLLASKVKTLFADGYLIAQALTINKSNQTLLVELKDIVLSRYSTGSASQQDVLRAEMEQNLLRHQAIVLQRQRLTIIAQLNTLLNRPVDSSLTLPKKLDEISELPTLKALQSRALQLRPELKAIAADMNAHKTQNELAALAYYPDLKLSAGYNSLWDNEDKRFYIGVGINIPLDQSQRRAAEQQAKANSQQVYWRKIDMEAKIHEAVAIHYAQLEESRQVLSLFRQQLSPLANASLAAAKAEYQSGSGDFITLLDSEEDSLQSLLQTHHALANVHRHLAKLEQAVGSLEPLSIELQQQGEGES